MATIGNVQANEPLGGLSTELLGIPAAYLPIGTFEQTRDYNDGKGPQTQTVMRCRVWFDAEDGEGVTDRGIFLIFWDAAQNQIREQVLKADVAAGKLKVEPQKADPTRKTYTLDPLDDEEATVLASAMADVDVTNHQVVQEVMASLDDAPF